MRPTPLYRPLSNYLTRLVFAIVKSAKTVSIVALAMLPLLTTGCVGIQAAPMPTADVEKVRVQAIVNNDLKSHFFIRGIGDVVAGDAYVAASGRVCRMLSTREGTQLAMRRCQDASGQWYTTRHLEKTTPSSSLVPVTDQNL